MAYMSNYCCKSQVDVLGKLLYLLNCLCSLLLSLVIGNESSRLGDTSRLGYTMAQRTSEKKSSRISKWDALTLVGVLIG